MPNTETAFMNSKLYSILLIVVLPLFFSCKKWLPENRIVGSWKLVDVERRRTFDNETIVTGYENGTFVFLESGSATYDDATRQMTGTWSMRRQDGGYMDGNGNWHSEDRTILIVHLYNFLQNQVIDWYFDRLDFRNEGNKLFTYIDGANYTYRYDFRKQ